MDLNMHAYVQASGVVLTEDGCAREQCAATKQCAAYSYSASSTYCTMYESPPPVLCVQNGPVYI